MIMIDGHLVMICEGFILYPYILNLNFSAGRVPFLLYFPYKLRWARGRYQLRMSHS